MATSHSTAPVRARTGSSRHRVVWSAYAALAVAALTLAVVAAEHSGGRGSAAVVTILGLCAVVVGAALLSSVLSPRPENAYLAGRSTSGTGYGFGFGDGAGGGGGFGGDCGGGDAGSCS